MNDNTTAQSLWYLIIVLLAFATHTSAVVAEQNMDQLAATIDARVSESLALRGIDPLPPASPEVQLRRTYLSLVGRIPTGHEVQAYFSDELERRHVRLVDRLLTSEGHVAHFYHFMADALRLKTRLSNNSDQSICAGRTYEVWLIKAIRENQPFDSFVSELLTADGMLWDSPAIGYYLRDWKMPVDAVAVTSQVFLGQNIVCAQCHDHPFENVTQREFYQHAAFSTSIEGYNKPTFLARFYDNDKQVAQLSSTDSAARRKAANELLVPLRFTRIRDGGNPLRFPHDYAYSDVEPNQIVPPGTLDGSNIQVAPGQRRVEPFVDWLVSPDNPFFTKVIVNRVWKQLMGRGLFEPVDVLPENMAEADEQLLQTVCDVFIQCEYDLRALQNVICRTQTFRRQCAPVAPEVGECDIYRGPVLRRMTAAQVWDSLGTVLTGTPDPPTLREIETAKMLGVKHLINLAHHDADTESVGDSVDQITEIQKRYARLGQKLAMDLESLKKTGSPAEIEALARRIQYLVHEARATIEEEVYLPRLLNEMAVMRQPGVPPTLLQQVRHMLSQTHPDIQQAVRIVKGERTNVIEVLVDAVYDPEVQRYAFFVDRRRSQERRDWEIDDAESRKSYERFEELREQTPRAYRIDSPAPLGHFLRVFGQSDRELPDNGSDDPSIMQALALMNSELVAGLSNPYSQIMRDCGGRSFRERIEIVFRTMLGRSPTDAELILLNQSDLPQQEAFVATEAIIRVVVNSREFLFIQ